MTALTESARRTVQVRGLTTHPVTASLLVGLVLHLLWWLLLANSGGDIAAQDAWAEFARAHPGSAYNLSWYGGIHAASYSLVSPFVMAVLGVRTTMVIVGTISSALLALLVVRSKAVRHPLAASLVGVVALVGNAISGRVTFGLGMMFGLGALAVVFAWPTEWRTDGWRYRLPRAVLAVVLSALATASSPVAGLFLGVAAAGLWLGRRRAAAYCLGVPPVVVVAFSTLAFPFSGRQPMSWISIILPVILGVMVLVLTPRTWRAVRLGAAVYTVGTVLCWLVPSPVGTNVTRLPLLFAGVILTAVATTGGMRRRTAPLLVATLITSAAWQVGVAARDVVTTAPDAAWSADIHALVRHLKRTDAADGRVEVVPPKSHRDAAALAPYFNLARGWNRQADAERNPLFYDRKVPLTADAYRAWLDRWAVRYVVLTPGRPDNAARQEAALVEGGLSYLRPVWSNASWRVYAVESPRPLVDPPGQLISFGQAQVTVRVAYPAKVWVRIPTSPWLTLFDSSGHALPPPRTPEDNVEGCLSVLRIPGTPEDDWVVLDAPHRGTYRIAAPYSLRRGTPCPTPKE
ncbi:MFS transporter [Nocardioides sp. CER19]|uniref:MFS transporter n=1 Tax=Nocardioides sp. CER19 TaxID=3038538 RepID=UPI00244BCFE3|nr:MFS transporter [Nocardioides sp. CER19]MDH2414607.1 MFS transporter [Nocardioides sp. CER19]